MPQHIDPDVQKNAMKEAIDEWLDKKYAELGRWAFRSLVAAAFAGMVYLALRGQGWSMK